MAARSINLNSVVSMPSAEIVVPSDTGRPVVTPVCRR